MSSTYSTSLRAELIGPGDQAGAWGTTTNNNFNYIFDVAIAGYQAVTIATATYTLTSVSGPTSTASQNESVYAAIQFTGATGATTVFAPAVSKTYIIWNNSGYAVTLYNTGYTTGPTIANGAKVLVFSTGTAFYAVSTQTVSGVATVATGGTGATSFTSGALLKGAGTSPVTVASAADIVGQISTTAVTNATNATKILNTGGWNVTPTGTKLVFNYNGTDVGSLDSSGNFIVTGNITAYGTP
jgi:hypothetical protein